MKLLVINGSPRKKEEHGLLLLQSQKNQEQS